VLLLLGAVGGGGYWAYQNGFVPEGLIPEGMRPPLSTSGPVFVEPTGDPGGARVLSLLPLARGPLQGPAGSAVSVEVRARSSGNLPVANSLVHFQVVSGDGRLEADTARTSGDGIARVSLTLPDHLGNTVVVARLGDTEHEAQVVVESRAGAPARIVAREGDGQEGEVNQLLPIRAYVTVYDAAGLAVPGAQVTFAVASGGGQVGPSRAPTDSSGVASANWRLGFEAGRQQLSATLDGTDRSVTFTATARERPVATDGNPLPPELGPVTVVRRDFVIGVSHVCTLAGGVAQCRGANDRGQRGGTGEGGFVALATGNFHTCGLSQTGEASCWGANEGGQLGDGTRVDRPSPTPVPAEISFSALTAGAAHTCGLAGRGVPFCWGLNANGQVGDNSRTDARLPKAVGGGLTFSMLVAGWNHTCGLTTSGNAWCWGLNSDGQLGDGSRLDRLVPTLVRGSIQSIAAGNTHTCGASSDQVLCWGDNRFGQLGDGSTNGRPQPAPVAGLSSVTQVVAGAAHSCALQANGTAHCWGQNLQGQLGDGTRTNRPSPVPVAGDLRFRSLHAGGALTCGIATNGDEYCWGFNQGGQLGDGTRESRSVPTPVQG